MTDPTLERNWYLLQQRVLILLAALRRYGTHRRSCTVREDYRACDCGLEEAKA